MTCEEYNAYVAETAILNRKMIEMNIENQSKMAGVFEKLEKWLDLEIQARERENRGDVI
jgi:hypothetical protein